MPQTADTALFRSQHPNSYWWTPEHDFLALILQAVQGANWQRSGSKGNAPKRIERPDDRPPSVRTGDELRARRAAMDAELKRRRQVKEQAKLNRTNPIEQRT